MLCLWKACAIVVLVLPAPTLSLATFSHKSKGSTDKAVDKEKKGDELISPGKLGQMVLGGLIGGGVGGLGAESTMRASGADIDAQDVVGHLWAGALGGAAAAYQLKIETRDSTDIRKPMDKRIATAMHGLRTGAAAGLMGGALAQMMSGSSDPGGSSVSSQSGSSSFDWSSAPKDDVNGQGANIPFKGNAQTSLLVSGNMPIIHNAIAGSLGGAAASYLAPEILTFAETLGAAMKDAASRVKTGVHDSYKGIKRANVCVSRKDAKEQKDEGKIQTLDEVITFECPESYVVSELHPDPRSYTNTEVLNRAAMFMEQRMCENDRLCGVPVCDEDKCPVPGCQHAPESLHPMYFTYRCTQVPKANVCISAQDFATMVEQAKTENGQQEARIIQCPEESVIVDIAPEVRDFVDAATLSQARDYLTSKCAKKQTCAIPPCVGFDDTKCPVPGCEYDSDKIVAKFVTYRCDVVHE